MASGVAGPAFPAAYLHKDGGTYDGEWRGKVKYGFGVYRYGWAGWWCSGVM